MFQPNQNNSSGNSIFKSLPIVPLAVGAGGLFLLYKGGTAIGKKLGIVKDEAAESLITSLSKVPELDKLYLTKLGDTKVYKYPSDRSPKEIATAIYNSKGFFKDDKDAFWAAVKRISYRTQLTQVSDLFYRMYQKDLASYISTLLKQEELQRFLDYLNSIPSGIYTPPAAK